MQRKITDLNLFHLWVKYNCSRSLLLFWERNLYTLDRGWSLARQYVTDPERMTLAVQTCETLA